MKIVQSNREVRHELGSRVRIREGKQLTNRDLANSAQPPPPPSRKAGSGREEVEGNEEERAGVARGGLERRSGTRRGELGLRGGAVSGARLAAATSTRGGMSDGGSLARGGRQARRSVAAWLARPAAAGLGGTAARRWTSRAHGGVAWREEGDEVYMDEVFVVLLGHGPA